MVDKALAKAVFQSYLYHYQTVLTEALEMY